MRQFFLLGLLILLFPFALSAQNTKVSGKVLDASTNEPLVGVTVVQTGTQNGTITDIDGNYSIDCPADANLTFSYIGYVTQTVFVNGKSTIPVYLNPDDKTLEQVVVVGYGTMKKSDVSGSVVSVDAKDMMKRTPTNVAQGLQGAAAGVMVTAQDGAPDGKTQVRIRGVATINGSAQPLYVVDGIQVGTDASFINPSDIESMEVLKDASATAIYGAAGANGVIMITTKHGAKGKAKVDFTADFGVQTLAYKLDVYDADGYAALVRQNRKNDGLELYNPIWEEKYDGQRNEIDWQEELTRVTLKQQYTMSVAGGNEKSQTSFSASYLNNRGIVINTQFERLTARLNNKTEVTNFLELGGDMNYVYTRSKGASGRQGNTVNLGSQRDFAYMSPSMDYIDDAGNIQHVYVEKGLGRLGKDANEFAASTLNNPYSLMMENNNLSRSNRVFASAYAQITFFKGLTFKSVGSFNFYSSDSNNFTDLQQRVNLVPGTTDQYWDAYGVGPDGHVVAASDIPKDHTTNSFSLSQSQSTNIGIENYFNYNWKNDIMSLNLMLGQEASNSWGSWVSANTSGFKEQNQRSISLGSDDKIGNGAFNAKVRGVSYFGRFTYSLFDKYILTATVRRDGSSNFGSGNRFGTFPSLAFAWRISQEDFLKDNDVISNLKLRIGWGQTGNSGGATSLHTSQTAMTASNGKQLLYAFYQQDGGMGLWNGVSTTTAGTRQVVVDTDLKWETNEQTNIGIDLGLLQGQFNITMDYFIRKSKDLLLTRNFAASSGVMKLYTNYGEIENKGFEFQVNWQKHVNDWTFGATFTGSTLKNKVKKMGDPQFFTNDHGTNDPAMTNNDGTNQGCIGAASGYKWGDHSVAMEGEAVGSYYGYVVDGIFQSMDEINALTQIKKEEQPDGSVKEETVYYQFQPLDDHADERTLPGDYKYKDLNGDGKITEEDRQIIGNGFPKFNYGINLNVSYKNWDFSIYGYGVAGLDILSYSSMRLASGYIGDDGCMPNVLKDNTFWTEDKPNAEYARLSLTDGNWNRRVSTAWVKKGDYFKISNFQIGYTFNKNLIEPMKMTNARIYFAISNLALFSSYKKYGDPECGQGCVLYTGLDTGRYPNPRTFQMGISFSF